jgi:fatty acid desaturase
MVARTLGYGRGCVHGLPIACHQPAAARGRAGGGVTTDSAARPSGEMSARSGGSDYARLSRAVRHAGLMDRRPGESAWRIAITLVLLAAGWVAVVMVGNSWWQLAVAVFLAVMFTQVAFLGHEAGHRQICASRRLSYILGILLGNLGIGLSFGWWVAKHNRHHANPNTEGADPDIMMRALAMTAGQARLSRGVFRVVYRCQAFLFFPMLLGEAFSVHIASIRALSSRARKHWLAEAALLAGHIAAFLAVAFLVMSPVKAVVFILIQQGLFGVYLGASFAPNHKGMPVLRPEDNHDFLRRQVLTSRNIRGGWFTDLALGGLNYQIEHHLFPSMPRPSLRSSQPLIREFCQQNGLPYCQTSLIGSYTQALRYLHAVGTEVPA